MSKKYHIIGKGSKCGYYANVFVAMTCILVAVIFVVLSFKCDKLSDVFAGTSVTFATLAGAILVFSTLELQRRLLNEEKHKNEIERFDSRFYPILSSFRTDASNMEITGYYLSPKGIGETQICRGERAFAAAKSITNGIDKWLCDNSLNEFESEEFNATLHNYSAIFDFLDEHSPFSDETDKVEKEKKEYIRSCQIPYIVNKWGITKDDKVRYQQMDNISRESFLLDTLIDNQSTTLSKYVQSLRFILQLIRMIEFDSERKIYYQHISCLMGKKELAFLKSFGEFGIITRINYG